MHPRRSVLYMPGANPRAMDKARTLACDSIIFDLEDAVAPGSKAEARGNVAQTLQQGGYGYRELIVRCNGTDTPWWRDDVAEFAGQPVSALLFPKIESLTQVEEIAAAVDEAGGSKLPLWLMIETPVGVLDLAEFAGHSRVTTLVMGTSDLVKELRAEHVADRRNLDFALQRCVMIARRYGRDILDGVHLDFRNLESFRSTCEDGRAIGFDGRTLIHPGQIDIANEVFGFDAAAIEHAHRVMQAWQEAITAGKGVAVLDGKLIENLHAQEAERVLAFAAAVAAREA